MTQLLPLSIILGVMFLSSLNNSNQHPFLSALVFVVGVLISMTIFDITYNVSKNVCNYINPSLLLNDSSNKFYSNFCGAIGYIFSVSSALYLCPIANDWLTSLN